MNSSRYRTQIKMVGQFAAIYKLSFLNWRYISPYLPRIGILPDFIIKHITWLFYYIMLSARFVGGGGLSTPQVFIDSRKIVEISQKYIAECWPHPLFSHKIEYWLCWWN